MNITLSALLPGQQAVVRRIDCDPELLSRLEDLGMAVGLTVRCLHRAPAGTPAAYEIRGAAIALRREDADLILMETEP